MTIVEKIKNVAALQTTLKETFKSILRTKGVVVEDSAKLKDYPQLIESMVLEKDPVIVVSPTIPEELSEGMIWIQPDEYTISAPLVPEASGVYTEIENPWTT